MHSCEAALNCRLVGYFPPLVVHIMLQMHHQSAHTSEQFSVTLLRNIIIKASPIIITNLHPVLYPLIKRLLTGLKWKWWFIPASLINLAHLWLGGSAQKFERRWSSSQGLNHLPMDLQRLPANLCSLMDAIIPSVHSCKVPRGRRWSQHGLDAGLIIVYLRFLSLLWEKPAELCYLGPMLPFLSHISFIFMWHFWPCWEPVGSPHPCLCLPTLLFHLLSLRPSKSRIQGPRTGSPALLLPRSIGPIVYSLHQDTKDIKLTDQWAGARPWLINEALGREDGWKRELGEGRCGREGWTGRLTDAQSADQSMGTFAELR